MTGETINKMTGEVIDHNYDGVIMLSNDMVYFNDAQPRPDGRKIYHIFEQCPSSLSGEPSETKSLENFELLSKASENNIEHIREVLACNGILYDEWCPPITPLTENLNGICQKQLKKNFSKKKVSFKKNMSAKKAKLTQFQKRCKNGKENFRNGKKVRIAEKACQKQNNRKTSLLKKAKTSKDRFSKSKSDPLYVPELDESSDECTKGKVPVYQCNKCNFCSKKKNILLHHRNTHLHSNALHCSLCSFKTNYKNNFKGHLLTVHDLNQEKCLEEIAKACNKQISHHKTPLPNPTKTVKSVDDPLYIPEQDKNSNGKGKVTPSPNPAKIVKSRLSKLEDDPLYIPELDYDSNQKGEVYRCNKCTFWSDRKNILKYHQITHLDKKVLNCSFCSFKTNYKSSLKGHLLTAHELSQERCLEEISNIQNIITVLDSENSQENCESKTVLSKCVSEISPKENECEKYVSSIRLKKEIGMENGEKYVSSIRLKKEIGMENDMIPSYNIVPNETQNNIYSENTSKLMLPDAKVILTRLSPEMVAVYTQHKTLKLTLTKLEKENKESFSQYKVNEIKRGRSIILSKRLLVRKQKSKYCRIKALRHKKRSSPKMELPEILNCSHCNFKTRKKVLLKRHIFRYHDMVYSCAKCSDSFLSEFELEAHHLNHKEFRCRKCDYSSHSKLRLAKHESSHKITFSCDNCILLFSSEEEYLEHYAKQHKPKPEHFFKCRYCSYTCKKKKDRDEHHLNHLDVGQFKCKYCAFATDNELELTEHNFSHPKSGYYVCSRTNCYYKSRIKASVKQHELSHMKTKMYKCTQCDYGTNYKGNLRIHEINNHTENKQYQCNKCDYSSQYEKYLDLHKISHMEGDALKCLFCQFTSELKTVLRSHIIEVHHTQGPPKSKAVANSKQDYICEDCGFTTSSRTGYNQHKKTHLSVKEFKCSLCTYETNFKGNLLKHHLVHTNLDNVL